MHDSTPSNSYGPRSEPWGRPRETGDPIWTDNLEVTYLTDADAVAAVLPPPLTAGDAALLRLSIATWTEEDGSEAGEARVSIQAKYEEIQGEYPLLVCYTSEAAVVEAREIFGEPAKLAQMFTTIHGKRIDSRFERNGQMIGRIVGTVNRPDRVETRRRTEFTFRPTRAIDDPSQLAADPDFVRLACVIEERKAATVGGIVRLGGLPYDTIRDLPMRNIRGTRLVQQVARRSVESVDSVDASDFQPFLHQRYDDLSA